MTLQVTDAGNVDRLISAIEMTDVGNVNRVIEEIRVIDSNGVDRVVFSLSPPMSVGIAPSSVWGGTLGTGTATTDAATATPSGGTAPYSYVWDMIFYTNPVAPTPDAPTGATSTFTQTSIGTGQNYSAIARCTVTDSSPTPQTAYAEITAAWSDLT